eukprot:5972639-Pyramimonas_sp.AAC.1
MLDRLHNDQKTSRPEVTSVPRGSEWASEAVASGRESTPPTPPPLPDERGQKVFNNDGHLCQSVHIHRQASLKEPRPFRSSIEDPSEPADDPRKKVTWGQ